MSVNRTPPLPAALCVSIHDVAPHTWPLCARLVQAVQAVAPIPLTLLVVPAYHHLPVAHPALYERHLEARLARGDELALHGYSHLDEAPRAHCLRERFWREVFTTREGEFAAIGADDARWRLSQGLAWFDQRNWPVEGFVAPAWLLGSPAAQAINDFPFRYTTTLRQFHLLPGNYVLNAPVLVYSARNPPGRWLSRHWNTMRAILGVRPAQAPLLRLCLHPNDAHYPALIQHFQHLIAALLEQRTAMTKAAFASCLRAHLDHQTTMVAA